MPGRVLHPVAQRLPVGRGAGFAGIEAPVDNERGVAESHVVGERVDILAHLARPRAAARPVVAGVGRPLAESWLSGRLVRLQVGGDHRLVVAVGGVGEVAVPRQRRDQAERRQLRLQRGGRDLEVGHRALHARGCTDTGQPREFSARGRGGTG